MAKSVGVLFVHGIGSQRRGSTLAQFGDPLIEWMRAWTQGHGGSVTVRTVPEELDAPAHTVVVWDHPGHGPIDITLAECWWANAFPPASFGQLLMWMPRMAYRAMWRMSWVFWWLPAAVLLAVFLLYPPYLLYVLAATAVMFAVILLLPLTVLALLAALAVLPPTRRLARSGAGLIANSAGDAFVLMRSDTRFSAMRSRFVTDLAWLNERVDSSVVVAHSQGSVIAVEALASVADPRCDMLVTVGSALRLLRSGVNDPVERLALSDPQPRWIDIYSQIDPVSAGPVVTAGTYPVEVIAQNGGSVLMAHTKYVDNAEGFQTVLLAAIGFTATDENIFSPAESAQIRRALAAREMRCATRLPARLVSVAALVGGALWLNDIGWARRAERLAGGATFLPGWARDGLPAVTADRVGVAAVCILSAGVIVAAYGLLVIMTTHTAWHNRDARALAQGKEAPRWSAAKVGYALSLLGLAAAAITSFTIGATTGWAVAGLIAALAGCTPIVLMFATIGHQNDTPDQATVGRLPANYAHALRPLYPAFKNKILQYSEGIGSSGAGREDLFEQSALAHVAQATAAARPLVAAGQRAITFPPGRYTVAVRAVCIDQLEPEDRSFGSLIPNVIIFPLVSRWDRTPGILQPDAYVIAVHRGATATDQDPIRPTVWSFHVVTADAALGAAANPGLPTVHLHQLAALSGGEIGSDQLANRIIELMTANVGRPAGSGHKTALGA